MKKFQLIGLVLLLALVSCQKDKIEEKTIEVSSITLNEAKIELIKESTSQFIATILPEDASEKELIWTSSDETIATVSDLGLVTAKKGGLCEISVVTSNNISAKCNIEVYEGMLITFNKYELELLTEHSETLIPTILPTICKDETIAWSSSDDKIATVDDNGKITGVNPGHALIVAELTNGSKAICMLTVNFDGVAVESITFDFVPESLFIGHKKYIQRNILPEDASIKKLTWSTSDSEIATVDWEGVVLPLKKGNVTITAEAHNGVTQECTIEIKDVSQRSGFRISPTVTLTPKKNTWSHTYIHRQFFTDADKDIELSWTIDKPELIDFEKDENGKILRNYFGDPKIIFTDQAKDGDIVKFSAQREDGEKSDCVVTLNLDANYYCATSIFVSRENTVAVGKSVKLDFTISPQGATDKSVYLFAVDDTIVSTNNDGTITGLKAGVTTVNVWSAISGDYGQCIVTVTE